MRSLELSNADFSEYLQDPTDADSKYALDVYSHLGGFCFLAYSAQEPNLERGGVRHGLAVISRLIRIAVKLYPDYAKNQEVNASPDDLRSILLQSAQTPLRFAGMPNTANHFVESHFGLKNDILPDNVAGLYRFEHRKTGSALFVTDNEHFWQAASDGEHETPSRDFRLNKKCPMTRLTREVVWPGMVSLAAETPEAFARDLEAAEHVRQ